MADRIIAGQNTPTSVDAIDHQDASDILENKLTQLQSLLSCCYGDGGEWFDAIAAQEISFALNGFLEKMYRVFHILKGARQNFEDLTARPSRSVFESPQ